MQEGKACGEKFQSWYGSISDVLGFDCQWYTDNNKRKHVALIQLCSKYGYCGLFHLNQMKGVPVSVKQLLENRKIWKVGVDVKNIANSLSQDYGGVYARGVYDVRYLTGSLYCTRAEYSACNSDYIPRVAEHVLGRCVENDMKDSDWTARNLSLDQTDFAAIVIKINL